MIVLKQLTKKLDSNKLQIQFEININVHLIHIILDDYCENIFRVFWHLLLFWFMSFTDILKKKHK